MEVCPRPGRRAAQLTVVALRSLLRFLHLEGELERSLAGAVPSVAVAAVAERLKPHQKPLESKPGRNRPPDPTPRAPG